MSTTSRSHAARITALALAGAVNALFLSLWLLSRPRVSPEAVATAMIWITAPPRSMVRPTPDRKRRAPSIERPVPPLPAPAPTTAITVSPIDWYAEGIRSARDQFKDEVHATPEPSLQSSPHVLVLPDQSNRPHKLGDEQHFEGGEILTWINERCYYSSKPTDSMFGGPPRLKLPTCKNGSSSQQHSKDQAADLEQAITPDYLRSPLPLPVVPAETSRD